MPTMKQCRQRMCDIGAFYSIFLGATALRIDLEKRQLQKLNRWIRGYVLLANICFLGWIPYAAYLHMAHGQLYATNPIAKYANYITIFMRIVLVVISILTRPKRDEHLEKWLESMCQIQMAYFDRFKDIPKLESHRKWLYLNMAITYIHTGYVVIDIYIALFKGHFWYAADLYPLLGMVGIQHVFMLHHGLLLCQVRECLSLINNQLRLKLMDPKLSLIFAQVRSLLQRLNKIYSPVILCIQLCLIISNSMVGYIGLLMMLLPDLEVQRYDYLFGGGSYLLALVHMYTYFMICEWTEATVRDTDTKLFECNTAARMSVENNQEIEKVALSRSLFKRGIQIAGMFNINFITLFSIIAQTFLYITILTQIDYGNFKR